MTIIADVTDTVHTESEPPTLRPTTLAAWTQQMRELITENSRPITTESDPRLQALIATGSYLGWRYSLNHGEHQALADQYVDLLMPFPSPPIDAPRWSRSTTLGETCSEWVDVIFHAKPNEWSTASASISQFTRILLDDAAIDPARSEIEPFITINTPNGDLGGSLSEMKDAAGALIMAICLAEGRSLEDFAALRTYLEEGAR